MWVIKWCDNYARGILRCYLARGGTLFFMEDKICSFFGHRKIEETDELKESLTAEILKALDSGCRHFYFGGFGTFDALCHKTVTKIKNLCPEISIKRIFCVHTEYHLRKKHKYLNLDDYEDVLFLEPAFRGWYKSIYFRNCAMIDKSDFVIFYAESRADSGAYKALKYAQKRRKNISNLHK